VSWERVSSGGNVESEEGRKVEGEGEGSCIVSTWHQSKTLESAKRV